VVAEGAAVRWLPTLAWTVTRLCRRENSGNAPAREWLTVRQRELLHLVAAGHTNAQIARRLGISEGTVRTHLENIYRLLEVSSRTAAVTRAFADRTA
jgi:DNA-binding NarL/FixJ family response regulator